jgi:RNA polymerase sigma-70 factor (ECF subfamily)
LVAAIQWKTERYLAKSTREDMELPQPSMPSDRTLLLRFKKGEADAATGIYLRYAQRLQLLAHSQTGRALAVRLDAEDVVQSVFRTFFRRAAQGHYDIPDGEELWKLFLVLALNKIRGLAAYHRAAKRDVGQTIELSNLFEQPDQDLPDSTAHKILRMTVDDLLGELAEPHRSMVVLRIDGYSIQQIAAATGRSKRSVERTLQSFRLRLCDVLNEE